MGIIDEVKSSCLASLEYSGISLDEDGLRAFLRNLDEAEFDKFCQEHGYRFPLKFQNDLDELNFLSVLTILNYLSAYRIALHRLTGSGAFDTIRRFVLNCYLQQSPSGHASPLSAKGMASMTESQVAELLGVPMMTEKNHPTLPGVRVGERDKDAVEIVGLVLKVVNETGKILLEAKASDLGDWVAGTLQDAKDDTPVARCNYLVSKLVETFPAFADHGSVKGHTVKVYKKAQLLAFIIAKAFEDRVDTLSFPLPSKEGIPACVDNVLPTMAVYFRYIDLSKCVYPLYANGLGEAVAGKKVQGLTQTAEEAFAIRAATLAACERVVELIPEVAEATGKEWLKKITVIDIDGYLWAKAKDGPLRDLPRLSEPGTVFY